MQFQRILSSLDEVVEMVLALEIVRFKETYYGSRQEQ